MRSKYRVSGYSGLCEARNAQQISRFWIFRALRGPECAANIAFLDIPGFARPGMRSKYCVSGYSGPCKARNAQQILRFWIFRALQGPECAANIAFLDIPGLARPGMRSKYCVSGYSGPCKARNAQ